MDPVANSLFKNIQFVKNFNGKTIIAQLLIIRFAQSVYCFFIHKK